MNQIKNLIKLILRLFCLVLALSCNNDKKNMITEKFVMLPAIQEHSKP